MARGERLQHAREYTFVGCGQVHPHGRGHGNYEDVIVNAATPLLEALREAPTDATFGDVLAAWRARFAAHVGGQIDSVNRRRRDCAGKASDLLRSLLTHSCIERGLDWHAGGADYSEGMVDVVGLTTVLDSLYAVKTAVFDEGRVSLAELREVLESNWAGREDLRQYMLRQVPKFGNDDATVDEFVQREAAWVDAHIRGYRTAFDGPWAWISSAGRGR